MNGSVGNGVKEQSIPLVPDKNRPVTSQYVDLTLVPERPPEPRAMFTKKLGARIEHRKHLLRRRRWLVDLTLAVAVIGIVLMVVENELYFLDVSASIVVLPICYVSHAVMG